MSVKHTIVNVNASGGATVALTASRFARGFTIAEDGSGASAGLQILWPDGSTCDYGPSQQPIVRGNISETGTGSLVGVPANINNGGGAATQYCTVISMGVATKVRLEEYS